MKKNLNNLFTTQFLGVLNDNLLKNLICFVSIYWASPENKSLIVAIASATMVLPFIFLSPLAGYLSQVHAKSKILRIAKFAEIPIMLIATVGFVNNSITLVMISMLLMGVQSALYSPAKYGLIKDLSKEDNISKKLGTMEMLSFVAVLSGSLIAGIVADLSQFQLGIIGLLLTLVSFTGWLSSKKIDMEHVLNELTPKKVLNPITFAKRSYKTAKAFKGVNASIIGLSVFWFIGSLLQMNLLIHCPDTLGLSNSQTGFVTAFVAVGIGVGCWVSGLITKNRLEMGLTFFAGIGLTISTLILSIEGLSTAAFIITLMVAAFFGGLFKIPLNAWIQQRTDSKELGNILAYSNMIVFLFILLSAIAFAVFQINFSSYTIFMFTGIVSCIATIVTLIKMPVAVLRFFMWIAAKAIYKININEQHHIPVKSGGIIVSNHVSLLDALLLVAVAPRNMRFIMHEKVYNAPFLGLFFKRLNMIPVGSNKSKQSLIDFTNICKQQVESGHVVCIFPEGQLSRTGQLLPFKKGIEHLAKQIDAPIIPLHIDNLVGTPLSYKTGTNAKYGFNRKTIKKTVTITVGEPITQHISAYKLRQTVKDLEVINFKKRTLKHTTAEGLVIAKKQKTNNQITRKDYLFMIFKKEDL
jgi:1-acyl-sn-glycerol-3-phosphate acyltransferase